jgi:hypothetical protein
MTTLHLTDAQIRAKGIQRLVETLGASGAIRFMKQFDRGAGDYTKERWNWLGEETVRELAAKLPSRRKASRKPR